MDQVALKKEVQALVKKEGTGNDKCADCSGPNPQWASLSYGVFVCLTCAGDHRRFGVHITFVRSVSMDNWQEDQLKRMELGGNRRFKDFLEQYTPASVGGYEPGMSKDDKYGCWAAEQYKEKLSAEVQGKPWSPAAPPVEWISPLSGANSPGRPSSAQGLRKSRTSARTTTGSSLRQQSASPASFTNSPQLGGYSDSPSGSIPQSQKAANESYFAGLGAINASRPDDLPPSQGGRYQGFGNTPSPTPGSSHPSYGLSSMSAPSLADFQENPTAALSKGWSLFSSALVGATRTVQESVIQPGLERVRDPEFQANVRGYVDAASKQVTAVGSTANTWSRQKFGVDVAEQMGGLVDTVKERTGMGGHEGYGALAQSHDGESWERYEDEDDFFQHHTSGTSAPDSSASQSGQPATATANATTPAKKADDWDEWKDF